MLGALRAPPCLAILRPPFLPSSSSLLLRYGLLTQALRILVAARSAFAEALKRPLGRIRSPSRLTSIGPSARIVSRLAHPGSAMRNRGRGNESLMRARTGCLSSLPRPDSSPDRTALLVVSDHRQDSVRGVEHGVDVRGGCRGPSCLVVPVTVAQGGCAVGPSQRVLRRCTFGVAGPWLDGAHHCSRLSVRHSVLRACAAREHHCDPSEPVAGTAIPVIVLRGAGPARAAGSAASSSTEWARAPGSTVSSARSGPSAARALIFCSSWSLMSSFVLLVVQARSPAPARP